MDYTKLITEIIQNRPEAVEQFYNMTYSKGFSIALQMMKNEQDAMDVMQDSYIKALRNLYRIQDPEKLQAWFYAIVNRTCLDLLRKRKMVLFSDVATNDADMEFENTLVNDRMEFVPEANLDYTQTKEIFKDILFRLPEEQRTCVLMYYYEELSVGEIADQIGCSAGTVKSRLNYARKKIKEEVMDLEKKGVILHVLPIPFMLWMLTQTETTYAMPGAMASAIGSQTGFFATVSADYMAAGGVAGNVTTASGMAGQAAAVTAKAGMSGGLKALLICGVLGVAGAVGIGTGVFVYNHTHETVAEAVSEAEAVPAAEASITPEATLTPEPTQEVVVTETPTPEPTPEYSSLDNYRDAYKTIINNVDARYQGYYNEYYLYDIDGNGILELIIREGTCEADYEDVIYTADPQDASVHEIGRVGSGHSSIYKAEDGNGIFYVMAHMNSQMITRVTIEDGNIKEEVLSQENDISVDDYYHNSEPLAWCYTSDLTLLSGETSISTPAPTVAPVTDTRTATARMEGSWESDEANAYGNIAPHEEGCFGFEFIYADGMHLYDFRGGADESAENTFQGTAYSDRGSSSELTFTINDDGTMTIHSADGNSGLDGTYTYTDDPRDAKADDIWVEIYPWDN